MMGGTMFKCNSGSQSLLPIQLKEVSIPRAFIKNDDTRWVLCDLISDLQHEEKQAIYYSCVSDATLEDVAQKIELSTIHVASVLTLYMERLTCKLDFFKRIVQYDEGDMLSVSELLFPEQIS